MRPLLLLLLVPGVPAFLLRHSTTTKRARTTKSAASASGYAEYPEYVPSAVSEIEEPVSVKAFALVVDCCCLNVRFLLFFRHRINRQCIVSHRAASSCGNFLPWTRRATSCTNVQATA